VSYPVVLYPRLLVHFLREHPLPSGEPVLLPYQELSRSVPDPDSISELHSTVALPDSPPPATGLLVRWLIFISLAFGVLGFNLVAVGNLPKNFQQPVRAFSLFGAAFAVAGLVLSKRDSGVLPKHLPIPVNTTQTSSPIAAAGGLATLKSASPRKPPVSRDRLLDYLEVLKAHLVGQVLLPVGVSEAPLGRSEDAFASVLEFYFPGRVRRQLEFPIPQSDKGRSFSTDFAVVLEEIGLYIDIEVDEPYDLKKRRPTHCIDDYHDRYRNGFFLKGNWVIIRFAEEQVVRYPKACCREIASCVFQITGIDKFLKPLVAEPILRSIPQWSKKEARRMAKLGYRDTYLSLLTPHLT
jgi:hypothetical protein